MVIRRAFVVLGILLTAVLAQAGTRAGRVVAVSGEARVVRGDAALELAVGTHVEQGDVLETGKQGRARLLMSDRSLLNLGPGTRLSLREYQVTANRERQVSLKLLLGKLWARVTKATGAPSFEVATENAVAGVRGTELQVDVSEDGRSEVTVISGSVGVGLPDGAVLEVLGPLQRGTLVGAELSVSTITPAEARAITAAATAGGAKSLSGGSNERLQEAGTPSGDGGEADTDSATPQDAGGGVAPPVDVDPSNRVKPAGEPVEPEHARVRGRVEVVP